ncbi:hypothetical protein A5886_002611 [Enterococcus sp. 8G7_MSG3316]|uniref:DNA-binding response regulator n=1 Tax=Candidatus Enterococcus testudinis TaxID=1834191 RepID=A0A242A9W2_9ENTE|nr:response regulator transcription factor [Enterococcus sp. 8G7_MSG3316]OTN77511.1 hypothetical protein A5886_002611 [Enterococcus sp. 8G7_MSG3316]
MNILIVEDNKAINNLLVKSLQKKGYQPIPIFDGESAANYIEQHQVDLILLDIMLPLISGEELIGYFVEYDIPVIFLTAKHTLSDKVRGLNLGAEDYITKPFELEELFARIETVLRRTNKQIRKKIKWHNIHIEDNTRRVFIQNQLVTLTPREYQLFVYLVQNRGIVLARETIYQRVWEDTCESDSRTLDLHIQRIRKKLQLTDMLRTIYGVGYILEE